MSTLPENDLDLEKLFLPAWAQEPASTSKYAKYEGESESYERRDRRGDSRGDRGGSRPPRRDGGGGAGGGGQGRGPRPSVGGDRRPGGAPGGPTAPAGENRFGRGDRRPDRGGDRGRSGDFQDRRPAPLPLPDVDVDLIPDEKGVESLARQIKITGRAYPLFDIAQMILQKPERHTVVFTGRKAGEGKPAQPLFFCALDETLWLTEEESIQHVIRKHFGTFYQTEKTATEPPKGKYTFVGQCGISGVVLGPPNHHDYLNQLRKLHGQRFARMPFDVYKSRIKIVRDEEVVKKWVEDQSWKTEFVCLNVPDALRLGTMAEVEKHFREVHKDAIIKQVETYTLSGSAARNLRSPELTRLVRSAWEDQRRFPLQTATVLSQQFASRGLQFFKVNKAVTHVCVARPHYLDLVATPVSDGVKRIVEYINAHPKTNRRQLIEALAPSPAVAPIVVVPVEAPVAGEAPAAAVAAPEPVQATAEQASLGADLHWLIHQGHVIEFATGVLETAKKPLPKPPKPEKPAPKAAAVEAATAVVAAAAPAEPSVPTESAVAATEETAIAVPAEPTVAEVVPAPTQVVASECSPAVDPAV